MQARGRQEALGAVWTMLFLILVSISVLGQECRLTIREDMYFLPATEMAGETSYPEVVVLENESIEVWSVPNRGRLLFDLIRKETGNSQLVARATPLPLEFLGVYTFEFGGVYSTFPWHKRDNQPLLLHLEAAEDEGCAILMSSQDPETDITLQVVLEIAQVDPSVHLIFRLLNPRDTEQTIDLSVVIVARPGGKASEEMALFLPVPFVVVGKSDAHWMGVEGTKVVWPAPWSRWGAFRAAGWFQANLSDFTVPSMSLYNPQADEHIAIGWNPQNPWTSCLLFSWGPGYRQVMGAYEGFRIEIRAERLNVPARGEQALELQITTGSGRPSYGDSDH